MCCKLSSVRLFLYTVYPSHFLFSLLEKLLLYEISELQNTQADQEVSYNSRTESILKLHPVNNT